MVRQLLARLLQIIIKRDKGTKIDFVGNRKKYVYGSAVVVGFCVVWLFVNWIWRGDPLNYGIDFKGGTQVQIEFRKAPGLKEVEIKRALKRLKYRRLTVIKVAAGALGTRERNDYLIRMEAESGVPKAAVKRLKKAVEEIKDPKTLKKLLFRFRVSKSGDTVSLQFHGPVTEEQVRAAIAKAKAVKIVASEDAITRPGKAELNKWRISIEGVGGQLRRGLNTELKRFVKRTGADQFLRFNQDNPFAEAKLTQMLGKAGYVAGDEVEAYVTVRITQILKEEQLRKLLADAGVPMEKGGSGVVPLGETGEKRWRILLRGKSGTLSAGLAQKLTKAYVERVLSARLLAYGAVKKVESVVAVGSKVGRRLRIDGIMSVLITLGLILVYIGLRFDLKYAPGAVIALMHDVIITTGIFAIAWREFNLDIIAALLTIVGYSLNDTIVLFDRIRENLGRLRDRAFDKVVNTSINETLSRTVLTSLTTMLVVVVILILGTGIIWDFALALGIGVLVGTYSSVFIASPTVIWLHNRLETKEGRGKSKSRKDKGPRGKARAATT